MLWKPLIQKLDNSLQNALWLIFFPFSFNKKIYIFKSLKIGSTKQKIKVSKFKGLGSEKRGSRQTWHGGEGGFQNAQEK